MKKLLLLILFVAGTLYAQPPILQPNDLILCDTNNSNDGFEIFDLISNSPIILNGLNPNNYTLTFHETQTDADLDTNSISNPNMYQNSMPNIQTIYVRVEENANTTNYATTSFNLIVNPLPIIPQLANLIICDTNSSGAGIFDLSIQNALIISGNPQQVTISYYETLNDAQIGFNQILNPTNYINIDPFIQAIFVGVENNNTGCFSISNFDLIVNPLPTASIVANTVCAGTSGTVTFFGTPSATINYLDNIGASQTIVLNGTGTASITTPILTANSTYTLIDVTSIDGCIKVLTGSATVTVVPLPIAIITTNSPICSGETGTLVFNGTPNATVQYTVNGAAQTSITLDPNGLANLSFSNLTVDTTICLVNVTSATTPVCTQPLSACAIIDVNPTPQIGQPPNLIIYQNPFTGFAIFDLNTNATAILNGIDPFTVDILFYLSLADAQTSVNQIPGTSFQNFSNPQTVFVRVEDFFTGCVSFTNFDCIVVDSATAIVNIPDANFKAKLIALGVDTNTDNEIQYSEALVPTTLNVSNSNIGDLTGIEAFTNLATLNCSTNNLTTLNLSSNFNLTNLYFPFNLQLQNVFIKNGSDESTNTGSGSWLENFLSANNPALTYICADQNQVANIQSLVSGSVNVNSNCTTNPGGNYNSISGIIQYDFNANGCDVLDNPASYMTLNLSLNAVSLNNSVYTNFNGNYIYNTNQIGTYELIPNIENPTYFNVTPNPANVNIPVIDNSTTTQNFCITANGVHPDLEIIISPIVAARPGFDATYKIIYKNKGNQILSGNLQFNYNDAVLDYVSSTATPDNQSTGNLGWNYVDLKPFESKNIIVVLNVNSPTETPSVNIGDLLNFSATINPITGDETIADNTFTYNQTVVGSYDPNDKTCLEGNIVSPSKIGDYLHYNINFENTGTAPATFIVVKDVIDVTRFNIATLQILNASHEMITRVNGNKIEFIFDNINLAASGKGNVTFKIKTLSTLTVGASVTNKADIYFDYNFPIETNVASSTFQVLSNSVVNQDNSVGIYPNPSKDIVNIKANSVIKAIEIYDVNGRIVQSKNSNLENEAIDISNFNKGIYFIKIKTEVGQKVEKLVKE